MRISDKLWTPGDTTGRSDKLRWEDLGLAYRDAVLDLSPSIFLPLDGATGLTDLAGNYTATESGTITIGGFVPGPLSVGDSGATDFGSNAVGTNYNPYANGAARTFMGWAYRDTNTGIDTLFASNLGADYPRLYMNSGGDDMIWRPDRNVGGAGITTWPSAIGTGVWFHYALIVDEANDEVELYINGSLDSLEAQATPYHATPGDLKYAGYGAVSSQPWDGKQAWVSVHEAELTGPQILAAYNAAL